MKKAKYELSTSRNNKHYFNLVAPNGKVIVTSQMYDSKQGAFAGIASVKNNAGAEIVEI